MLKTKQFHQKKIEQKFNLVGEDTYLNKTVGKKVRKIILARKVQLDLRKKIQNQFQNKIGLKGRPQLQRKVLKILWPNVWSKLF